MKGAVVLVFGVLFVLRDWNVWNFWNIQPWTAVFLLVGLCLLFKGSCKSCKKE
jgi:drug/metabolite transporter (DMT)-like permease